MHRLLQPDEARIQAEHGTGWLDGALTRHGSCRKRSNEAGRELWCKKCTEITRQIQGRLLGQQVAERGLNIAAQHL